MEDLENIEPADLSLENMVISSLNYENLRMCLNYILGIMKNQQQRIQDLESRESFTTESIELLVSNNEDLLALSSRCDGFESMIGILTEDNNNNKSDIALHSRQITELKDQTERNKNDVRFVTDQEKKHNTETTERFPIIDERLSDLESTILEHQENLTGIQASLDDMRRDYDDMSSMAAPRGGGFGSAKSIEMANKLRDIESKTKELELKFDAFDEVTKSQIKKLKDGREKIELDSSNAIQLSQSNRERLDELTKNVRTVQDDLNEKVGCDDFDVFRAQLNTSNVGTNDTSSAVNIPIIPSKDMNTLKDNIKRIEYLEADLSALKTRALYNIRELSEQTAKLQVELADKLDNAAMHPVREGVTINKHEIEKLKIGLDILDNRAPIITTNAPSAPQDTAKLHVLELAVEDLDIELKRLRKSNQDDNLWKESKRLWTELNDYMKSNENDKKRDRDRIEQLNDFLGQKVGSSDLQQVVDKFGKIFEGSGGIDNLASKHDLKRAYQSLFSQLTNITEYILAKNEDDAMIAKKPLGGWSCASCDTDLEKLTGKVHGMRPSGMSSPLIPKGGPGYSKMIGRIRTETTSTTQQQLSVSSANKLSPKAGRRSAETLLPNINEPTPRNRY